MSSIEKLSKTRKPDLVVTDGIEMNLRGCYQPGPYLLSCQMLLLLRISENNTPPNFRLAGGSNSFSKIITPPQFSIEVCQILETDKELSGDQNLRVIHL